MIWPFDRKKEPSKPSMMFTNGDSLFDLTCKYGHVEIVLNVAMVAIVLDAKEKAGIPVSVKVESDGTQTAMLKVVSPDGGFTVMSKTTARGPLLSPGDAVVWVPIGFHEETANISPDRRLGWVGMIRAKINFPTPFENPLENITTFDP
jgi:hypothetical protein